MLNPTSITAVQTCTVTNVNTGVNVTACQSAFSGNCTQQCQSKFVLASAAVANVDCSATSRATGFTGSHDNRGRLGASTGRTYGIQFTSQRDAQVCRF